jgi:hypothetical protein
MTRATTIVALAFGLAASGCDGGGATADDAGPVPGACEYPSASGLLRVGEVLPELGWQGALDRDGTPVDFRVRDFHCSDEYDRYTSMILLVSAGWCSSCPAYIDMLNGMAESLEAQGTLVVYVEVETADFTPATSADAAAFVDECIAPDELAAGLRAGDADNLTDLSVRSMVSSFPSAYFVRRRDMRIVADQSASIYQIDFGALAADPEQTWTPALPAFEPRCDPSTDEESGEPNDSVDAATAIAPGTEISGGVCMPGSDYYHVTLAGPWRFDLYQSLFTMPDPDLHNVDLRLWGEDGERIGGSNVRGNHDWVDYEGPAYVEVYGARNASGTYRVSVTPR